MAESIGKANAALAFFQIVNWETSSLAAGDRVFFLAPSGEDYPATVVYDWESGDDTPVEVSLDCLPKLPVVLHRSLFRAFTVLDHLANA